MNDDTISRAAAIDAVKKNTFRLTFAEEQNCEGHVAWSANAVYSDVIEGALLELPSAQPDVPGTNVGDMVNRAAAIDILDAYQVMVENGEENPYALARLRMSELPSAQAEIIRCKNCKHRHLDDMIWDCPFGLSGGEDFFCAYGAKDGDSDDE